MGKLPVEGKVEEHAGMKYIKLNPNVADLYRGKTRQSALDVASRSLG